MGWAFNDEEPAIWVPGERIPPRITRHIQDGGELRAWNAQFERVIWNEIMRKRYIAPPVHIEQWVCTAAEAAAMALPRHLAGAAAVLGVGQDKDKKGHELMLRMCRPRSTSDDGTLVWWDVEERKKRLFEYCRQDVRVERAASKALRRLTDHERRIYILDQRMNDRGICIDRPLIRAAQNVAYEGVKRANATIARLTHNPEMAVTSVAKLAEWVNAQGVTTAGIAKARVRELLDGELPDDVRTVLELRAEAGRSSVAKLTSMLEVACTSDDRARGLMLYHGASTGRWTGKLIQPHNFPKGEVADIESFIHPVMAEVYDYIDVFAPPIVVVSSMLRSMLVAGPGKDLIAADFSAIEARVLNWLAGQDDMLDNFRAYDAGDKSRDPYIINAMRLYGIPFEQVQKQPHRHTGKFQELACGFGMGAAKAVTAAKDIYELTISPAMGKTIVDNYRATHPAVKAFWKDAEDACVSAINEPGRWYYVADGRVKIAVAGAYLYIVLPSGRPLMYAAPAVVLAETPWGALKLTMEFACVNSHTHQWGRETAYGGLIVENIVQAVARDLMADAMLRLALAGYPPVLCVHDEIVCEVPKDFGSVLSFEGLMRELPTWATGCPVAVEGWRAERYRK